MKRLGLAILLLAPQEKSAEDLFKAFRDSVDKADTIRVEYTLTIKEGGRLRGGLSGIAKVKGGDRWSLEIKSVEGFFEEKGRETFASLLCDGRKTLANGVTWNNDLSVEDSARWIRGSFAASLIPHLLLGQAGRAERKWRPHDAPTISAIKDGGKQKIGDVNTRVIEYTLAYDWEEMNGESLIVKIFVDPERLRLLRREFVINGREWVETYDAFALNEDLPDSDFSFQSRRRLARARSGQLARSVELYASFTGRHPRSLDDLLKRPAHLEPEIFWPDGGFVLGGKLPRDPWGRPFELRVEKGRVSVVSLGAEGKTGGKGDDEDAVSAVPPANHRAVGAPTERLQKYYTARVQVHLMAAVVRAFRDSYGELPRKKAALWEKPPWAEVWPDGGWLPDGRIPDDPWGEAYRMVSDASFVRVQSNDPKKRFLTPKHLTDDEKRKLEEIARPRFTDEEKKNVSGLLEALKDDDLDTREEAEGELLAWGPAIVPFLEEQLKGEPDPDTQVRLRKILRSIPPRRVSWVAELTALSVTVGPSQGGGLEYNEQRTWGSLRTIATAQADFRSNDRDSNRVNDFWSGDIAGLYMIDNTSTGAAVTACIKLIEVSVALADAEPQHGKLSNRNYSNSITTLGETAPKSGYWFRAMKEDKQVTANGGNGKYGQDTDGLGDAVHNTARFGACAYPAEYGVTGTKTFIINEGNTGFWKDTQGEAVLEWPTDAELASEWHVLN